MSAAPTGRWPRCHTGGARQLLRNLIHTDLEPSNFSPPQDPPVCGHVTGKDKQGLHHGL